MPHIKRTERAIFGTANKAYHVDRNVCVFDRVGSCNKMQRSKTGITSINLIDVDDGER